MRVHKIAGTAKIFGYPALGDDAIRLEDILNKVLESRDFGNIPENLGSSFEKFLKKIGETIKYNINAGN